MPTLHDLTDASPEEAADFYLRERSAEVTDSTLQSHKYRLSHFVRQCDEAENIDNMNALTGRDLHRYRL